VPSDSDAHQLVAQRYRLEALLRQGGMGEVYRALDLETNEPVAVKRLRFKGTDADRVNRARFAREITTALTLQHPNIVRALDGGEDQHGLFLVMEHLEGVALKDHLLVHPRLEWERAVALARHLCSALGFVHSRKILHRDVKADNCVLVATDTDAERLVLIDFGIARGLEQLSQLTSSGMLVGTAMYCAPEQIAGLIVDHRADLYAFGVLLFRMLAGVMPFEGPELPRVIYAHMHTPPPSVRLFAPGVPEDLEAIVLRCLAKDPAARFENADALERALRATVQGGPAELGPTVQTPAGPSLSAEAMLEFVDEVRTFDSGHEKPPTDELERPVSRPRPGRLLLQLKGQTSPDLRALTVLSWAARLAPFFDTGHITLERLARLLERSLAELCRARGPVTLAVVEAGLTVNGERIEPALGDGDFGAELARLFTVRGLEGLVLHRAPTTADVELLLRFLRTGQPTGLDALTSLRIVFRPDAGKGIARAANPLEAWKRVVSGIAALIEAASRGRSFDTFGALQLADVVVAEAQRPGRRLLGVTGQFDGIESLAAQAANAAFTATAMALDLGLPPGRLRDVAHLAVSTSVGMIQVHPLALTTPEQLSADERSLLRQTPVSVIRAALAEAESGPTVWRRMVLGYELSSELSRGLDESLGRGELPMLAPSVPTRIVFTSMTWWGLRAPRPGHAPATAEQIAKVMRGPLRLRLDGMSVGALERAFQDFAQVPAQGLFPGSEHALVGWTPQPGAVKKLLESGDEVWKPLAVLMQSLVATGLDSRDRILPLLLPVVDTLLMQDELGTLNGFIRTLKAIGGQDDVLEVSLARDLVAHLSDDECVALLTQVLNDGPPRDPREFARLLSLLEPGQVGSMLRLLDLVTNEASQAALFDAFAVLARTDPAPFVSMAKEAGEARAVELVAVLARAREHQTMAVVHELWPRAQGRSRARMLDAVARLGSGDAMAFLSKTLKDPAPQLRLAVIDALARTQVREANQVLLEVLTHPQFSDRPGPERAAVFEAVALRGEPSGIQALQKVVLEKPPLMSRGRFNDDRKLLASALAKVGGLQVVPLLQTLAQDARQAADVREAATQAVAVIRRALSGQRS
jgi:serine/threonine-protein kinase